jgi:hypothetical protein
LRGLKCKARGQGCIEVDQQIWERLARPRGDNQRRDKRKLRGTVPAAQPEERVRAHQAEKRATGRESSAQALERVDGVVRGVTRCGITIVAGFRRVGKRSLKARLACNRQPSHRHAVFKGRDGTLWLERLHAHRRKQHRIQREGGTRGSRHGQMAVVRRVKTPTKEGYARRRPGR